MDRIALQDLVRSEHKLTVMPISPDGRHSLLVRQPHRDAFVIPRTEGSWWAAAFERLRHRFAGGPALANWHGARPADCCARQ